MSQEEENSSSELKGEAKSIPSLYKMELSKGYFNSNRELEPLCNTEMFDNHMTNSTESKENEESFNAWKAKNSAFNQSQTGECSSDMVSNLGKSLRQCQYVVPKSPPYNTNLDGMPFNMGPKTNPAQNMEFTPNVPFTFDQQNRNRFQETHINPNQYYNHDNNHTPVKYFGERHFHPNAIPNFYTPVPFSPYDISPKTLPHYPLNMREKYPNETLPYNHFYQSNNWSPQNHKINTKEVVRSIPHCRNDEICNCSTNSNKEKNRKIKKDEKQNKQISDLYRIVYLQNQQLGLLQKQVQKLIELNTKDDNTNSTECGGTVLNKKYVKGTSEKRTFNLSVIKEKEKIEEKVSVGIMTSFVENNYAKLRNDKEVKVFPRNFRSSNSQSETDDSSDESSSEEEEEEEKSSRQTQRYRTDKNNVSLTLNDVVVPAIEENVPSPQTSFHIEMQEYKTSSDSDCDSETSSSDSNEKSPPPVGWTFYDTVVGKVNDILKKSSLDKEEKDTDEDDVRNATLDQLRQLGVSFVEPESPLTKRVTFNNRNNIRTKLTSRQQLQCDSETSLHMNALANKYLKKEEIISNETVQEPQKCQNNLSHATLKYLERYQLSPNDNNRNENQKPDKIKKKKKKKQQAQKEVEKLPDNKRHSSRDKKCGKVLDITAIKKQPKLLPKN
ncbi:hypothetical protein O3M35_001934 [Rhynocoris fuscipes]|uniref:STIL coiled coil region domain-containing protein n=1 Tax=Rhynocoris fuscipes TaxID=488301 RepID=A0AAW1CP89_9HEMI